MRSRAGALRDGSSLRAIGYWRGTGERQFPRPQWLVRLDWHNDDLGRIAAYLRSGFACAYWLGHSYCRFGCGIDEQLIGSSDLTDGEWVWPEGLVHYVERHLVHLPEPLVNTMRCNDWRVPLLECPPEIGSGPKEVAFDFSLWVEWARRHQRRPWYALW